MTDDLLVRARLLDAADPLASLRDRFLLPKGPQGDEQVYLCGHSLGLQPRDTRRYIDQVLDDWARLGVEGHHAGSRPWIPYAEALQDGYARLAGAQREEVVGMNTLTVNLHLLMASFYRPAGRRVAILVEEGAFSSDRHAVVSQIEWHGLDPRSALIEVAAAQGQDIVDESQVEAVLAERGEDVALVLWPGVQYRTGQAFDLGRIAEAARRAGAHCGFDLAHGMGNTPLSLHDDGADFAVWCGYKYLNGGPGALAGAFVHARHAQAALPRLAGWWGHDPVSRFRMEPGFIPTPGAAGWQLSNPPILSTAPLLASLDLFDASGSAARHTKTRRLGEFLESSLRARLSADIDIVTPPQAERRGSQFSLRVRGGRDVGRRVHAMLAERGILTDWREPDIIRAAPVPLYNRFEDAARLVLGIEQALEVA
ncbi:MAG: kynureninase [Pseudomonadota bacterium]|jgi:kynureninase